MKLLHIISTMDPQAGGVSQAVNMMVTYSVSTPVEHYVLSLDDADSIFLKGYSFPVMALGGRKTSWAFSARLLPWLKKNLGDYDFVILHGLWQFQSFAIQTAILKFPTVTLLVMPHGMLDPYFQRAAGRKFKAIRNSIIWHMFEKRLIRRATGLLFTCETERLLARETFRGSYFPKKEFVVGLGINRPPDFCHNMETEFRKVCGLSENRKYLLFLSRINSKKGIDLLVRSYLRLQKESVVLPALVIAGPGMETDYGMEIKSMSGNNDSIFFPGMLSGSVKWGAFYCCEAFILPSHQENFGIAVAEALACRKPVLISDKVNIWQEVADGRAGLVEDDTDEGTYLLLKKWMQMSNDEKQEAGNNALKVFEDKFEIVKSTETLAALLQSIKDR